MAKVSGEESEVIPQPESREWQSEIAKAMNGDPDADPRAIEEVERFRREHPGMIMDLSGEWPE